MEDLYSTVTARIVAELEEGRLPWVQPWDNSFVLAGFPRNAGSGRPYSGINILILWQALFDGEYTAQRWLTFKQAEALGGHVRKGERGVTVCYADRFTPKDARGGDGGVGADTDASSGGGDEVRKVAFLKRFTVFNVAQCDGLPDHLYEPEDREQRVDLVTIPEAEALIAASGANIAVGSPNACYRPRADRIEVPLQAAFIEPINYYRTVLHELGHNAASGIMPRESLQLAGSPCFRSSPCGIMFGQARPSHINFWPCQAQPEYANFKVLKSGHFPRAVNTWHRIGSMGRTGKSCRIMPNAREENPPNSALFRVPFGIIQDTAL
ncbi:ArdC-like ssDNA-binding domain-containing protein [Novosphingobium sp.]|uniref:ArdC family protein n=1 Tax=Novosphingobium sp. TaxID=1874826 RepID=UPI0031DE135A